MADEQRGPAGSAERASARLAGMLALTDDELLAVLDADPLSVLSGEADATRPELAILVALLDEAREQAGDAVLRRWVRASGPEGRPLDHLLARDFAAFEDALATLGDRGFVLRRGGPREPGR